MRSFVLRLGVASAAAISALSGAAACHSTGTSLGSSSREDAAEGAPTSPRIPPARRVGNWARRKDAGAVGPDALLPGGCQFGPETLALPPDLGRCAADACADAGGLCTWGGFGCDTVCALRTRDEGASCMNRSECESECVAGLDASGGSSVQGHCSPSYMGLGCVNRVENGVARGTACAD